MGSEFSTATFVTALRRLMNEAQERGANEVLVRAGDLHKRVGGYPGQNHRMPMCCQAMYTEMTDSDQVVSAPPKGKGASLTVRYLLPRSRRETLGVPVRQPAKVSEPRVAADPFAPIGATGNWHPQPTLVALSLGARLTQEGCHGRIGLVGCVKRNLDHSAPAADLYVSPLFRGRRAYVERTCERWFILSALHGVARPDAELEPYDVTLNDASQAERRSWAAKVLRQLDAELGSCDGLTFAIHAGANYADFGLVSGLRARGATVERPVAGLKMGQQLAFYANAGLEATTSSESMDGASSNPCGEAATGSPSVAPQCQDGEVLSAVADLDDAPALVPACDWPAGITCLDQPGLYSWVVDSTGAADLSRGLGFDVVPGRIYAGQAGATKWPSGKAGNNTLGKRIGQMHLGGRVRMSTFRWTLASVLFDQLDVQVQASMVIAVSSEDALTEWMRSHLSVAVHPHDDRDTLEDLERQALVWLDPPLNLRHMQLTPVRARLTELRRRISREL